jgi:transcriptional regulator with XRE-family HTH domain
MGEYQPLDDIEVNREGFAMWKQVGSRITKVRTERNLSKERFGEMLGVSGQHIGRIERGKQKLSAEMVVQICGIAGVSADYILFGVDEPAYAPETLSALSEMTPEQFQIAIDIIKKVAMLINTKNGNEALIQEVLRQQRSVE